MSKCKCKEPILQPQTKQCGKCKKYIDRVRHILLTNQTNNNGHKWTKAWVNSTNT